ncbi:hypothetical protein L3Y34_017076 [Caenorhabditis briggsae]|uniref:SPK domain-containing protein n=1 Tax=Caenorhabditis briggsae TaxID=6238 RepID=A0AAE9ISI4_CAEBR|nr:hypothetical protein L3Y34_017076 [Caenorhabditis briggsae]
MPAAPIDVSYAIRYISDRIANYDKPECLANWCQEVVKKSKSRSSRNKTILRDGIFRRLKRIEKLEGYSLMEKLQLAFIFSRSVSDELVQILKDAKFEIQQDEKGRISRFRTEDGTIVRSSDHHRDVKYFQGVRCLNTPWQRYMAREKEHGQQDVENKNPNSEMMEEPDPIESEEIDDPEEDIPVELTIGEDVRHAAFNGHINYEELDAQEFFHPGFSQIGESEPLVKRAKAEQIVSEAVTPDNQNATVQPLLVEATPTIKTPDEPKISVMSLVTHIKHIAMYYKLEKLGDKASQAIEKMNKTGEDKTLSVKNFNISISFMLVCLEENRIREAEGSITLESLFEQLQMSLIRSLGPEIVTEALELISQKIHEFENEDDGVPSNLISESLTSLMIAT